jgi:hypothetical protein
MATQNIPEVRSIPKVTTEHSRIQTAEVTQAGPPGRAPRSGMVHLTPEELLAVLKTARSRSDRDWATILRGLSPRIAGLGGLRAEANGCGPQIQFAVDPAAEGFAVHRAAPVPAQGPALA